MEERLGRYRDYVSCARGTVDQMEGLKRSGRQVKNADGSHVRSRVGTTLKELEEVFRYDPTQVQTLQPRPSWVPGGPALGPDTPPCAPLERYARPGPEALARHAAANDPAARRRGR